MRLRAARVFLVSAAGICRVRHARVDDGDELINNVFGARNVRGTTDRPSPNTGRPSPSAPLPAGRPGRACASRLFYDRGLSSTTRLYYYSLVRGTTGWEGVFIFSAITFRQHRDIIVTGPRRYKLRTKFYIQGAAEPADGFNQVISL